MTKQCSPILLCVALALALAAPSAEAGCGCDKAPPALAAVRPAFASPGDEVTLFSSELREGSWYRVRFDDARDIYTFPIKRRDFADGVEKLQLVVKAPSLPPGPTRIRVERVFGGSILRIDDDEFTMLQPALSLPESDRQTVVECYRAAVGADGTVYIPLNVGAIAKHTVFSGIGKEYPLLFGPEDVVIYNTQGVVMQLLGPEVANIFAIDDTSGSPDSLEMVYDRHEFETYRQTHQHDGGYGLDPKDPRWHVDGTRHIDHDRLVLAIRGEVEGEGRPEKGRTRPFKLDILTMVDGGDASTMPTTTLSWGSCSYGDDD
jgi:hypothetical protein